MLFSERRGLKKVQDQIQLNSLDGQTRNLLWSALCEICWSEIVTEHAHLGGSTGRFLRQDENEVYFEFFRRFWLFELRKPIDEMQDSWPMFNSMMREYILTSAQWYEVFDFLELLMAVIVDLNAHDELMGACNQILERQMVPYRLVKDTFTDITTPPELDEVDAAAETPYCAVNEHINAAIRLLYDRKNPDYRNSVKESISAVEAICRILTGSKKATLSEALKLPPISKELHPAFRSALDKLYGYTGDSSGIRHSLMDSNTVDSADARFFLIECSAFVNYLKAKFS